MALALGANIRDPRAALRRAVHQLGRWISPRRVSSLYSTEPYGIPAERPAIATQPPYLNAVLLGATDLEPAALLAVAKALEQAAGRRRGERFGPRPLDIDLLLYGDQQLQHPELTLPHPRLHQRRFVLAPLAEIAPDLPLPPDGTRAAEALAALAALPDRGGKVERIEAPGWHC